MDSSEIRKILDSPLSSPEQKALATKALADLTSQNHPSESFDSLAEMWASVFRADANPERRAQTFEKAKERFKGNPDALRSFTPERETLRAKRNVYDQHGGDVIGAAFDEDIPLLLAEKGIGYYGTDAYYVMRGMTPEAAAEAAKRHMEGLHQSAIIDDGFRSGKLVKDCCKNSLQSLGSK
jgi:hypothetical protein